MKYSLRQLTTKYYKNLLKTSPLCNDIDTIIAEYVADLVHVETYNDCLDYFNHKCIVYQVETDDHGQETVIYMNRIPYSMIEYIFYKQHTNVFSILSLPPADFYVHLHKYLEECWREIGLYVFKKKPKCIVLNSFSITLDGLKYEGLPVCQDAYICFSAAEETYKQSLRHFCYNPRCLLV